MSRKRFPSRLIPQVLLENALDYAFRLVRDKPVSQAALGVGPHEPSYRRRGAETLGLVDDDGRPTQRARILENLKRTEGRLASLALGFHRTPLGTAWLSAAGKASILKLPPESALKFVRATGLKRSTAERRADGLKRWLSQLLVHHPVLSQNSAWLDVHRSVRFGSRPLCSLFGRDSTISRLLLIDGLKPRSSFGTPRDAGNDTGFTPVERGCE